MSWWARSRERGNQKEGSDGYLLAKKQEFLVVEVTVSETSAHIINSFYYLLFLFSLFSFFLFYLFFIKVFFLLDLLFPIIDFLELFLC